MSNSSYLQAKLLVILILSISPSVLWGDIFITNKYIQLHVYLARIYLGHFQQVFELLNLISALSDTPFRVWTAATTANLLVRQQPNVVSLLDQCLHALPTLKKHLKFFLTTATHNFKCVTITHICLI